MSLVEHGRWRLEEGRRLTSDRQASSLRLRSDGSMVVGSMSCVNAACRGDAVWRGVLLGEMEAVHVSLSPRFWSGRVAACVLLGSRAEGSYEGS